MEAPKTPKAPPPPTAEYFREARRMLDIDQEQAALIADVPQRLWWEWESGARQIDPAKWSRVRKAFGALLKPSLEPEPEPEPLPKHWWETQRKAMKIPKPPKPLWPDKTPVPPDKVKFHREVAQMTREQAAQVLQISTRAWQSYELGTRSMPQYLLDRFVGILTGVLDALGNPVQVRPEQPEPTGTTGAWVPPPANTRPVLGPMPSLPSVAFAPPSEEQEKAMADLMKKGLKLSEHAVKLAQKAVLKEQDEIREALTKIKA